jgi:predicted anti-sigma-YlaC factor YlaD
MIQCKAARKLMPLLDPDAVDINLRKQVRLEEHLKHCRECREYRAEQMLLRQTLSQSAEVQFSTEYLQDFTMRLEQRIDSKEKPKGWIRYWLHQIDMSPLPTLAEAAAVVWLCMIAALQFPGIGNAILKIVSM